ncbi:MAG: response regulator [Candidatus Melainabacteria bacterium]|nr:response regulator [Candidatus Melainabacteria bacterium]
MKKEAHTSHIPFVLLSAQPTPIAKYLADGVRTAARTLGCVAYIEMDIFDPDQFLRHINKLLVQKTPNDKKNLTLVKESGE